MTHIGFRVVCDNNSLQLDRDVRITLYNKQIKVYLDHGAFQSPSFDDSIFCDFYLRKV